LTFSHKATQGGVHAYDWLTGWDDSNIPPLIDPVDIAWGQNIGPPYYLQSICRNLYLYGYHYPVQIPDDNFLSKDGSTQSRIDEYELRFGDRFLRISGNRPITWAGFISLSHDVPDEGDTGNSFIHYELKWISQSDEILIEFGGHLALSGDPVANPMAWGEDLGASAVEGGPYHIKLDRLDACQLGSQDNQIQAGAVLPAATTMTVSKTGPATAVPGDTYDYVINYENTGPATAKSAQLVDVLPPEVTFISCTGGGTYDSISHSVTWNLGDVPSGGSGSVTLKVQVNLGLPIYTVMHNEVTLTWTNLDGSPGGPVTDFVDTTIIMPLMEFWKVVDGEGPYDFIPGDTIYYTLYYSNTDGADAYNVMIDDTLPDGTLQSFNIGTVLAGESGSVPVQWTIPFDLDVWYNCIDVDNEATLSYTDINDNPYDPITSIASIHVITPVMTFWKDVDGPVDYVPGDTVSYLLYYLLEGCGWSSRLCAWGHCQLPPVLSEHRWSRRLCDHSGHSGCWTDLR
jgi:uncharacterized repeat protein (TIGR01451 family)